MTLAESKATYAEIKKYVAEHNDGMKVSNLYIAQVKKKCGIELGQNLEKIKKGEDIPAESYNLSERYQN
ncbi:hypothetical protein [Dorea sp.]|uniref:hypothetical protein n=1 Tax=Dorea sp. TaxID=2040332 RepID=UPI0035281583